MKKFMVIFLFKFSYHNSKFQSLIGSEIEANERADVRKNLTEYDPLEETFSDEEGKGDIELSVLKIKENHEAVEIPLV